MVAGGAAKGVLILFVLIGSFFGILWVSVGVVGGARHGYLCFLVPLLRFGGFWGA